MQERAFQAYDPVGIRPTFATRELLRVLVPAGLRRCVVFIGIRKNNRFFPRATGFIASCQQGGYSFPHVVTAEHVVSGLLTKGHEIYVRINLRGEGVFEGTFREAHWFYHPDESEHTDVAVCPFNPQEADFDWSTIPLDGDQVASDQVLQDYAVGPGDEIAVIGLFRSHYGHQKNIPIVRIGNIAAMRGEPVETKYCGFIDAHLIEARSIGGLSGSPVFLSMQQTRPLGGSTKVEVERPYYLFGLMHGHFDIKDLNQDAVTDADTEALGAINTGVGVVVPVHKIIETVKHPDLVKMRQELVDRWRESAATADDVGDVSPPASDENPTHREDFNSLLGAAVRKREQED